MKNQVYAVAPTNGGPLPVLSGSYAGYFNGDLAHTGSFGVPSDSNLKSNIMPVSNAMSLLKDINCYSYFYDSTKFGHHINLPKAMQFGFLAQQVEQIVPSMVTDGNLPPEIDSSGNILTQAQSCKLIDYTKLIPLLLSGVTEQQAKIDSLTQVLSVLNAFVQNCCNLNRPEGNEHQGTSRTNIILKDNLTIILDQNRPNPFAEETNIDYSIPQEISNASIIFYDRNGRVLNKVEIRERGSGSIHIYAPDLSSGMYTYSLIADGKLIETKTMVKTK